MNPQYNDTTTEPETDMPLDQEPADHRIIVRSEAPARYTWVAERTARLLPEVCELINHEIYVPTTIVTLTTRPAVARRLGERRAAAVAGYPFGLRYRLLKTWFTVTALRGRGAAGFVEAGPYPVVYLDVALADSEREWGAVLAEQLTRAALTVQPDRSRHLDGLWSGLRSTLSPAARRDLETALQEAEMHAGKTMAETWRERFIWTGPNIVRAQDLLRTLENAVVEAEQPTIVSPNGTIGAAQAQSIVRRVYDQEEPEQVPAAALQVLRDHIAAHGTDPAGGDAAADHAGNGVMDQADRSLRLRAAAYVDLIALLAEMDGSEKAKELADTAIELAIHVRDYDNRFHTSRGQVAAGDLFWEGVGDTRRYVRQEWLALTRAAGELGQDER